MSRLWYKQPAQCWEEALPLGNGRMGAMVFGKVSGERIQLNEESMWYGGRVNRINPDMKEQLSQIREYLFQGQLSKAQNLMNVAMAGCPEGQHPYQTLGDMQLYFAHPAECQGYERGLKLDEATAYVDYKVGETAYHRELFVSKPADCMIARLTADKPGAVSFSAKLSRGKFSDGVQKLGEDGICLYGNLGRGGVEFSMLLRAKVKGGSVRVIGENLQVENADEAVLYFCADTTWHCTAEEIDAYASEYEKKELPYWLKDEGELSRAEEREYRYQMALRALLQDRLISKTDSAMRKEYEELWQEHIRDYKSLYDRVSLSLECAEDKNTLPTDERLNRIKAGESDVGLQKQLFDFGRYLLISCSREGNLPANLQGIWNQDFLPPWDSKYTININAEMNYWMAESCNLSECHMPFFDLLKKMRRNGRRTAREMYGCRGFVAHHNTDARGDCAPQDTWYASTYWTMGAAWMCTHIWTHYRYTNDKKFLKEMFPVMAEAALFFCDFLVEKDGYLVTCPSLSPENSFRTKNGETGACCVGAAMDFEILRDLFSDCLMAYDVLGKAETADCTIPDCQDIEALMKQIEEVCGKLPPIRIDSTGRIMEWMEEYEELEPGHRHISHLYALYPSEQITVDKTPELAKAAERTLEYRLANGGGHTGWSRAWIMNHYAKLWNGEKSYENIVKMLESSTYPNMFDRHPPFQIDGNFGACAAIAQMLVQSDEEREVLLPALPSEWESGAVKGLRLVGNAVIDLSWEHGSLTSCVIHAYAAYKKRLQYKEQTVEITLGKGEERELISYLQ